MPLQHKQQQCTLPWRSNDFYGCPDGHIWFKIYGGVGPSFASEVVVGRLGVAHSLDDVHRLVVSCGGDVVVVDVCQSEEWFYGTHIKVRVCAYVFMLAMRTNIERWSCGVWGTATAFAKHKLPVHTLLTCLPVYRARSRVRHPECRGVAATVAQVLTHRPTRPTCISTQRGPSVCLMQSHKVRVNGPIYVLWSHRPHALRNGQPELVRMFCNVHKHTHTSARTHISSRGCLMLDDMMIHVHAFCADICVLRGGLCGERWCLDSRTVRTA